jgi:hypothetical protein
MMLTDQLTEIALAGNEGYDGDWPIEPLRFHKL